MLTRSQIEKWQPQPLLEIADDWAQLAARQYRAIFGADIPDDAREKYRALLQPDGSLLPYEEIKAAGLLRNYVESGFNLIGADHEGHGNNMRNAYNDVVDYPG